ncbi:MAG: 5'-methylthioadenosine/S-adenosylhomocysteine nucleosidase [Flavobacteriaceae bacterium]|nr:MAG: 5'-methylthioadenosine/S-adenosylhomocysteine nucleosidase [Flavobacteriaceae bacterium]
MDTTPRIGILSAMHDEIDALLKLLTNVDQKTKGKRTYYTGTLFNKKVVLVFSRWGKVASTMTTTQLINDYNLSELIFTGVAGGLQSDLNIGDIIVGDKLYQHDLDASPLFPKFHIPLLNKAEINTAYSGKLLKATETFLHHFKQHLDDSTIATFKLEQPKVRIGTILSGDQFISSSDKINSLLSEIPTAQCVEMEGAAVAQVCYEYNIPFSIIRTISDKANDNATLDFPKFAKEVASLYAAGILEAYFEMD